MAENEQKSWRKRISGFAWIVVGSAVAGYWIGKIGAGFLDKDALGWLDTSVIVACAIAALYLLMGAIVTVGALWPSWGIRVLNEDDADEYERTRPMLRVSALAIISYGAALVLAALYEPLGVGALAATIVFFLLMVVPTILFLAKRKMLDELDWHVTNEATVATYYALLAIGGSWAACAHFGLITGPSMLDWLSMFWGLMLVGSYGALGRRGMLK